MAQQQQNISVAAPGFLGVNSQQAPTSLGPEWAYIADNCVIDRYGRVGSRSGYTVLNTSNAYLSSLAVESLIRFYDSTNSVERTLSAGNSKIWEGTTTPVDETPVAATVTADNWQMFLFNNDVYMVQAGHDMLMWDTSATDCIRVTDHGSAASVPSAPTCGLGAFGKLWVAKDSTVWWSDTLIGPAFSGGASGSLNLHTVWPAGYDEVVSLAEHNGFLIIFGKKSIIVYEGADSPASMSVADSIRNVGCAARDSVQSIGTDLLFLDYNGVRSLGRVIQEKSAPLGDISSNVHTDVVNSLRAELANVRAVYSGDDGFYLLSFPTSLKTFCFDLRNGRLENGAARTTIWTTVPYTSFCAYEGTLLLGNYDGICTYGGNVDGTDSFLMRYYSHPQNFGEPSNLKFPKHLDYYLVGGQGQQVSLAWGFGYGSGYRYKTFTLSSGEVPEFGVSEYGVAEYIISADVGTPHVNTTGSGKAVSMGFECTVNGDPISLQEINLQTLIGRIV
jgi:hypothetical protein